MDMGPTAVLDTGKVEIVVISRQQEPNDIQSLEESSQVQSREAVGRECSYRLRMGVHEIAHARRYAVCTAQFRHPRDVARESRARNLAITGGAFDARAFSNECERRRDALLSLG